MSVRVIANGLNVLALDAFLPSSATPGRFVIDASPTTNIPDRLDVQINGPSVTLSFPSLQRRTTPKVLRYCARVIYEDSRWMLRETIMPRAFNRYGVDGQVDSDSEKTLSELWAEIAAESGLSIDTQDLPDLKPPCPWAGRTALEAANDLLEKSFCVMNWNSASAKWVVAGKAPLFSFDLGKRRYRPVKTIEPSSITVRSAKKTYVSTVPCDAMIQDETGSLQTFNDAGVDPLDIFTGFAASTASARQNMLASAFRVWKPSEVTYPAATSIGDVHFLNDRRLQVCPSSDGSTLIGPQGFLDAGYFGQPGIIAHAGAANSMYSITPAMLVDGELVVTDSPIMSPYLSDLRESFDFIMAYHRRVSGEWVRYEVERTITGGTADPITYDLDWIPYIESDLANNPYDTTDAEAAIAEIADKLKSIHETVRSHVKLQSIVDPGSSGAIGGVRFLVRNIPTPLAQTAIAINFYPKDSSQL